MPGAALATPGTLFLFTGERAGARCGACHAGHPLCAGLAYDEKAKTVVLVKVWPGARVVDGKEGSFGESG